MHGRHDAILAGQVRLQPYHRMVVRFSVSPTANPSQVIAGSTDDRELGVHFDAIRVDPR